MPTEILKFNRAQTLLGILGTKPLLCHSRTPEVAGGCHEEGCEPGSTFKCEQCRRLMPYCWGAANAFYDYCDECAMEMDKKL